MKSTSSRCPNERWCYCVREVHTALAARIRHPVIRRKAIELLTARHLNDHDRKLISYDLPRQENGGDRRSEDFTSNKLELKPLSREPAAAVLDAFEDLGLLPLITSEE
jgi:hypothetical protein